MPLQCCTVHQLHCSLHTTALPQVLKRESLPTVVKLLLWGREPEGGWSGASVPYCTLSDLDIGKTQNQSKLTKSIRIDHNHRDSKWCDLGISIFLPKRSSEHVARVLARSKSGLTKVLVPSHTVWSKVDREAMAWFANRPA